MPDPYLSNPFTNLLDLLEDKAAAAQERSAQERQQGPHAPPIGKTPARTEQGPTGGSERL